MVLTQVDFTFVAELLATNSTDADTMKRFERGVGERAPRQRDPR
jgi:hypothetical protein